MSKGTDLNITTQTKAHRGLILGLQRKAGRNFSVPNLP